MTKLNHEALVGLAPDASMVEIIEALAKHLNHVVVRVDGIFCWVPVRSPKTPEEVITATQSAQVIAMDRAQPATRGKRLLKWLGIGRQKQSHYVEHIWLSGIPIFVIESDTPLSNRQLANCKEAVALWRADPNRALVLSDGLKGRIITVSQPTKEATNG